MQTDRQRWVSCWGISVVIHVLLLAWGTTFLIRASHFHVEAGDVSTELDLIAAPEPAAAPPAVISPLVAPPPAQPDAVPVLPKTTPITPTLPRPVFTIPTTLPTQLHPTQHPAKSSTAKTSSSMEATRGAAQAQPDELHNPPPVYPEESRAAHEQGIVLLLVEVSASGDPGHVIILKSSGYFRLDQAARRALEHWKFHPALFGGTPATSEATVPVHFTLQ
jgi:protein TonB